MNSGSARLIAAAALTAGLVAASYWVLRYFSVDIRGTAWQALIRGTFWNELRLVLGVIATFAFLTVCEWIVSRVASRFRLSGE